MLPGEQLRDSQNRFAGAGRGNNQKVSKLLARIRWFDAEDIPEGASAKKQARRALKRAGEQVCELVQADEAAGIQLTPAREENGTFGEQKTDGVEQAFQGESVSSRPNPLSRRREKSKPKDRSRRILRPQEGQRYPRFEEGRA